MTSIAKFEPHSGTKPDSGATAGLRLCSELNTHTTPRRPAAIPPLAAGHFFTADIPAVLIACAIVGAFLLVAA